MVTTKNNQEISNNGERTMLKRLESHRIYYGVYYDGAIRNRIFDSIRDAQTYIRDSILTGAIVIEIRSAFRAIASY